MSSISTRFDAEGFQTPSQNWRLWNLPFDFRTIVTGLWVSVGYYLGAKIGYRNFDVGYKFKDDTGSFDLKGLYFGVVARY